MLNKSANLSVKQSANRSASSLAWFRHVVAILSVALLFAANLAAAQDPSLTARVDRNEVTIEETLTLQVRYSGQVQGEQPDFSLLLQNFDIINQQRSNQISTINGRMNAFTEWTLMLAPKQTGKLLIPSFKFNGHFSDAIQIDVTEASAVPGELKDIFIETTVDESAVYVQQQILLTYRLYTTRSIDSMDAEPLAIDNVRIEELPQSRYQRRIDGINYGVLEVSYALFPQTSEAFTIPALRWTLRAAIAQNQRSYGFGASRYELKTLLTEEKAIEVAPVPDSYPEDQVWLPAKSLQLNQEWSGSPSQFKVGEPMTRTITLRAEGLTAAQLPPLPINEDPQGFRLYPDQPEQNNLTNAGGVIGSRTESIAVVPDKAGEITLPAVEVAWWDTGADKLRTTEIPAQTYVVSGNGNTTANTSDDAAETIPSQEPQPANMNSEQAGATSVPVSANSSSGALWLWQLATLIFALLWLIFVWLLWQARRAQQGSSVNEAEEPSAGQEKQAFKTLAKFHQTDNLAGLRMALLHWGACRWPEHPPRSLQDLSLLVNDVQISEQLAALDASLYGQTETEPGFSADGLIALIQDWRKHPGKGKPKENQSLKPLYRTN